MARTSGFNVLALNQTWTGVNSYNNQINANQVVAMFGPMAWSSTLHTAAATLSGGTVYHRCDTTTAAFTLTLPAGPVGGQVYIIKAINSTVSTNNLTISGNGHNIDAAATLVLSAQYATVMLRYDSTAALWEILAQAST